jgi:phosphoglycerate dehydrogenase-like enzyme
VDSPVAMCVSPASPRLESAVAAGGGELTVPEAARGLIWTDPLNPRALGALLPTMPTLEWIQLPFAGIEPFVEAQVLDPRFVWTCAKGIYGQACAEHALLLMLSGARRMHEHLKAQTWKRGQVEERRLFGSKLLIVGAGGIARELLALVAPLKMFVTTVSPSKTKLEGALAEHTDALPSLLPRMDHVVIAAPLTPQTRNLFDARLLSLMAPHAWLINVARGGLVDTSALVDALRSKKIGGAALDVTEPEPLPDGHPLWTLENAIITPHIANTRAMGAPELAAMVTRNVTAFREGRPLEGRVEVARSY